MKIGLYLDEISLQILKKGLFVSCEPKQRIEELAPGLPDERVAEIGETYLVCNMNNEEQGKAKLIDAFTTTFGEPDARLLALIGFQDNIEKFQKEFGAFYQKQFPDAELLSETELFVTIYEPVRDS
ncbi:MAG: hypothetical protein H7328_08995 [Bdellovibrio sp.]|nr:hypothetical protein [Bdellovibrio sp.]